MAYPPSLSRLGRLCRRYAHAFPRQRLRSRFPISSRILARRRRPVARGHFVSALGRMGKLGFWRAAFHLLPARFLAPGSGVGLHASLENRSGSIYLAGTRSRRAYHVAPRARMASRTSSLNGRHSLRRKSVSPRNRLLSQRFRRASRQRAISAGCPGSFARDARRLGPSSRSGACLCAYLALKRSRRRYRHILFVVDVANRIRAGSRRAPAIRWRHSHGCWLRFGRLLYFARCLGTALGSNLASAHGKPSSHPEFSVHAFE